MRRWFLVILLSCVTSAALACRPLPGEVFDLMSSPDLKFAVAKVELISIRASSNGGTCVSMDYSTMRLLKGHLPASISVESCFENSLFDEESLSAPGNKEGGVDEGCFCSHWSSEGSAGASKSSTCRV